MGSGAPRTASGLVHRTGSRLGALAGFLGADLGVAPSGRQLSAIRLLTARCCDLVVLLLATYLVCHLWFLGTAPPLVVIAVAATTTWGCGGFLYAIDALALYVPDLVFKPRVIQHDQAKGWRQLAGAVHLVGIVLAVAFMAPFFGGLFMGFLGLCGVIMLVFALFVAYYWACWTRVGTTLGGRIFGLHLVRVEEDRLILGDIAWRLLFLLCRYLAGGYAIWRLLDDVSLEETAQATAVVSA